MAEEVALVGKDDATTGITHRSGRTIKWDVSVAAFLNAAKRGDAPLLSALITASPAVRQLLRARDLEDECTALM